MKKLFILWSVTLLCMIGAAAKAERIMVISDLHLTADTSAFAETADAIKQAAATADTLILLGDNTNNSHTEEHAAVLELAHEITGSSGTAVLIIPGNHDYTPGYSPAEFLAQYEDFGPRPAFSRDKNTAGCAVMTAGGTCLLLLDTNCYDEARRILPDGGIGDETIAWAEQILAALPENTPVIACGHHPILPADRDQRTSGAAALADLLHAHGVLLYLCGHDHGFATLQADGLRQITVGQPHAYPGWAGVIEVLGHGFDWHTEQIYDPASSFMAALRKTAENLGEQMARGTLASTAYADDSGAVRWFVTAFMHHAEGTLTPDICARLLEDPACAKWREIETRTVVRDWMIGMLANCPESVLRISIR